MNQFVLKISETKSEIITYCGYSIDNCYVFSFEDDNLFYVPFNRLDLYKNNGKLTIKTI